MGYPEHRNSWQPFITYLMVPMELVRCSGKGILKKHLFKTTSTCRPVFMKAKDCFVTWVFSSQYIKRESTENFTLSTHIYFTSPEDGPKYGTGGSNSAKRNCMDLPRFTIDSLGFTRGPRALKRLRKFYCKSLNLRQRFTHLTNNLTKFNNLQILATICKSIQFRPNPPKIYSSL